MKNAYLSKEKVCNKVYQIKEAIWKVSSGFSWISKRTKCEGYIQIPFDVSWSLFKVCMHDSYLK